MKTMHISRRIFLRMGNVSDKKF